MLLCVVGIFGVTARAVANRARDLGIRMALGADRVRLLREVVAGQAVTLALGIGAGILGAVASSALLRRFLFGVGPFDPFAFVASAATLTLLGLAASYTGARRLSRLDPTRVMRAE